MQIKSSCFQIYSTVNKYDMKNPATQKRSADNMLQKPVTFY